MPKFAANLSMMFNEVPFLERFAAAAAQGFSAVEFLFPYDYPAELLAEKLREHGLQQVLFNTAPGDAAAGEWGLAALPGREQDARADIDRALASRHRPFLPQRAPDGRRGARRRGSAALSRHLYRQCALCRRRLRPARRQGADQRSARRSNPTTCLPVNTKWRKQWRRSRPNVFIQFDFFHAQLVDGNISGLLETLAGRYAHIQIASVPDRHEPDEGELNYPWLFDRLDALGYPGWIVGIRRPRGDCNRRRARWLKPYR